MSRIMFLLGYMFAPLALIGCNNPEDLKVDGFTLLHVFVFTALICLCAFGFLKTALALFIISALAFGMPAEAATMQEAVNGFNRFMIGLTVLAWIGITYLLYPVYRYLSGKERPNKPIFFLLMASCCLLNTTIYW